MTIQQNIYINDHFYTKCSCLRLKGKRKTIVPIGETVFKDLCTSYFWHSFILSQIKEKSERRTNKHSKKILSQNQNFSYQKRHVDQQTINQY